MSDIIIEPVKQIIVMRTDLGMKQGKMCAQSGHAVLAFALDILEKHGLLSELNKQWLADGQKKIALKVGSEQELIDFHNRAQDKGVNSHIITDHGLTQLKGHNKTCLALDPARESDIFELKKDMKLL